MKTELIRQAVLDILNSKSKEIPLDGGWDGTLKAVEESEYDDVVDDVVKFISFNFPVMLSLPSDAEIINWARETTEDSGESNMDAMEEYGKKAGAMWMKSEIEKRNKRGNGA